MTYYITNALGMTNCNSIFYVFALVCSLYTPILLEPSSVMRVPTSAGYRSISLNFYYRAASIMTYSITKSIHMTNYNPISYALAIFMSSLAV